MELSIYWGLCNIKCPRLFTINVSNDLLVPSVKTVNKGKDSAKYLGAVTWNSILSHIRQQDSLEKFCDLIKKWKPDCQCKLCKDYIGHIGYIQIAE